VGTAKYLIRGAIVATHVPLVPESGWPLPRPDLGGRFRRPGETSCHLHRRSRVPHRGTISTGPVHSSSVERGRPVMDDRGIKSDGFGARGSTCGTIERSLSGSRQGERAFQPLAIRQACLVPLALSAPSHESMVNGCAAASGEQETDLSEEIFRFGDILKRGAARRDPVPFGLCQFGCDS